MAAHTSIVDAPASTCGWKSDRQDCSSVTPHWLSIHGRAGGNTLRDYSFLFRSDLLSGSAFIALGEVIGSPTGLVA
jgi:hypothetical protein